MSKSKHYTPGPWHITGPSYAPLRDQDYYLLVQHEIEGGTFKDKNHFSVSGGVNRGTANLIAAAPDLLQACEDLNKFLDSLPAKCTAAELENRTAARKILLDAIAKAEGGPQ